MSAIKRQEYYPTFSRAADGSYWVVWEETFEDGVDLAARHLSAELEPMGELMRLTALGSGRDGHGAIASRPSLAIAEGDLLVAFSLEREALPAWCADGLLAGLCSRARFLDIGVPEDYARAQTLLATTRPASIPQKARR